MGVFTIRSSMMCQCIARCSAFSACLAENVCHCRVLHDPAHPKCPHTAHQLSAVYNSSPVFLLNPNQEVYSGKFEKYNYGSSDANRKHYNQVCDGRGGEGRGEGGGEESLVYIIMGL